MAYGLERLDTARDAGYLVIVEGESDSWTLWWHGLPALGVPGASAARVIEIEYLEGINLVFIIREPGDAGVNFIKGVTRRLRGIGWAGEVRVVQLTGAKDPNELHTQAPDAFLRLFRRELKKSKVVELPDQAVNDDGALPEIMVSKRPLREISDDAWTALQAANNPPFVFQRGHLPVDIIVDDRGQPVLRNLYKPAFKGILDRVADFAKETKGGISPARPPSDVVADMMVSKELPLPILHGIIEAPVFTSTGSLVTTAGYQPETHYYLKLTDGLSIPEVHDNPDQSDILQARNLLLNDLLIDFPFVDDADRTHAITALIQSFVRQLIEGSTPLYLIASPTPGTGKGLLADVLAIPAVGRELSVMTEGENEGERRKRITAKLLQGPQFIQGGL